MNRGFTNQYLCRPNEIAVVYLTSEAGLYASQRLVNLLF